MAPQDLNGLNIIHPAQNNLDARDLLSYQPDLSAQLDLWTNLPFESDEVVHQKPAEEEEESRDRQAAAPAFDISSLLAGFGVDPYQQATSTTALPSGVVTPSLAQLLALHSLQNAMSTQSPTVNQQTQIKAQIPEPPPAKRVRARKTSVSESTTGDDAANTTTPLSATEDKRRRNTAASARFRLKKKEREAALEGKAKELEIRVNELERECEGLRRENGWLKGLVVGVTQGNKRPRDDD